MLLIRDVNVILSEKCFILNSYSILKGWGAPSSGGTSSNPSIKISKYIPK